VHEAESRLRSRGCSKVNLQLRASNSQVARFYAALGYNEEPRVSMGRVL
jgi:ribosomal protein S18 acetylase RimI-like enzyme